MPAIPIFRRRKYLIKRGLQLRYIGLVFGLALLASVVTGYTVFATGWALLGEKLASVYPQGRLIYVFKTTNLILLRNLLLASPLIFIMGIFFSHKIAGPVYRIEKSLDEIARGNLALKIQLRQGDELGDLAELINLMTQNYNKTIAFNKETLSNILKDLESIKATMSATPYDSDKANNILASLRLKIDELSFSLDKWTTSP